MPINSYLKKELIDDLRFCTRKIAEEQDLRRKLYFFEKIHHGLGEIMDINYDKKLAFTHFTLEVSRSTIAERVAEILEENDTIPLLDGIFDALVDNLSELANRIEKDQDTYDILENIVEITYLTTASGYHQHLRGILKL